MVRASVMGIGEMGNRNCEMRNSEVRNGDMDPQQTQLDKPDYKYYIFYCNTEIISVTKPNSCTSSKQNISLK